VQGRIRELQAIAAEKATINRAALVQELFELATCDASELSRIVTEPCPTCWDDATLAAAVDRAAASAPFPDREAPRSDCPKCRGQGVQRVVYTPTAELSGAARRLYQSARTKGGSIELTTIDQLAVRRELHELLGMKVSRQENLNISATVPAPKDVSVADVLEAFHAGRVHGG